ncbi:MAG: serine/threonine protein kinase [Myxococcales bacterium]|nr:serine/threonine protein kinase [Myxococcales bacterium]
MAVINAGDVIAGKYRVERVLGEGGMGFVVAATHLTLETKVAIKFIREGVLGTREASVRFLREAKAAVQLKNPHVAAVYDVGTLESGEPFMVMEYLEGCDLSDLFKQRGALPPSEACEYVVQACDALGEAHALGIVHRDVKLGNLFLTRGAAGVPLIKVLDFGLSKASPFGGGETGVTMSAAVLGSPRFMSPEQLQDPRTVDGRSDIWSLGIILYTLIAGRPAFDADTVGKLFAKVMGEEPAPLQSLVPGIDPGLVAIIQRCLVKKPEQRISNVAELANALAPFCVNPGHAHATAAKLAAVLASSKVADVAALAPGSARAYTSNPPQSNRSTSMDLGGPWAGSTPAAAPAKEGLSRVGLGVAAAIAVVGVAIGAFYISRSGVPTGRAEVVAASGEPTPVPPPQAPPASPTIIVVAGSAQPAAPKASPPVAPAPKPEAAGKPQPAAAAPPPSAKPAAAAPKPKGQTPSDIPAVRD